MANLGQPPESPYGIETLASLEEHGRGREVFRSAFTVVQDPIPRWPAGTSEGDEEARVRSGVQRGPAEARAPQQIKNTTARAPTAQILRVIKR